LLKGNASVLFDRFEMLHNRNTAGIAKIIIKYRKKIKRSGI
jgi:hypothetical protein